MAIKVQCPQCHQGFSAPPTLAGKRVACPKCKGPISIPAAGNGAAPPSTAAPAKPAQKPAPQQSAPQKTAPQKGPPQRAANPAASAPPARTVAAPPKKGGKGKLLAVLAVVLLLIAGGGGGAYYYFVVMPGQKTLPNKTPLAGGANNSVANNGGADNSVANNGGANNGGASNAAVAADPKFDPASVFKYLPDESIAVVSLDLKGAMASPVYQKLQAMAAQPVEKANQHMSEMIDLKIEDIDAIVGGGQNPMEMVLVVHANRALDPAKLFKEGAFDTAKEGNFTLYKSKGGPSACVVDANTLVAGMPGALKKVLARNAEPNFSADLKNSLAKADFSKTLVIAAAVQDATAVAQNFGADERALEQLPPKMLGDLQSILVQAHLSDQIDVSAAAGFKSADTVNALKKMLEDGLKQAKGMAPKEFRPILDSVTLGAEQSTLNAAVKFDVAPIVAAMEGAKNAAKESMGRNNLKMLALAMLTYEAQNQRFPPRAGPKEMPLLSWRVMILPYIGQDELFKKFNLNQPWDSEQNKPLIDQMPSIFQSPTRPHDNKTTYLVPVGKGTIYEDPKGFTPQQVADGMSKTIMLVEVAEDRAVIWTKPDDFDYNPDKPLDGLGQNGFGAAFADGAVRLIKSSVPPDIIRAFFTRAGGEAIESAVLDQ